MAHSDKQRPGYARLLDAWTPPEKSLEPVGCLATTFTFAPPFFEEECLARFLQLETEATTDGVYHLIEREEKLSQVTCAAVMVDQHHCRGARSLRWDMLSARLPQGILHAKISLLCWNGWTRVIVASANLTEDGYRRNQEVFATLDFHANSEVPRSCLSEIITFLREATVHVEDDNASHSPAVQRWHNLLDYAETTAQTFGNTKKLATHTTIAPVLISPQRPDALTQLRNLWPHGTPPDVAWIVSPFFDPPESENKPAYAIWDILHKRTKNVVNYCVAATSIGNGKTIVVQAPQSLRDNQPASSRLLETRFHEVVLGKDNDKISTDSRPLHAKCIRLENIDALQYMIGSSNFTSAGLGINHKNLEANLVFTANKTRDPNTHKSLLQAFPPSHVLSGNLQFQSLDASDIDETGTEECLPPAFGNATYDYDETEHGKLHLTFVGTPPAGWEVADDANETLLTEAQWIKDGKIPEMTLKWAEIRPPSGLWVRWKAAKAAVWWPVNIVSSLSLPPPEELRKLPLDILLSVLTSALPLHKVISKFLDSEGKIIFPVAIIDPHKKVDTSQFLLQRTRRVSLALRALRERLEKPVPNEHCLNWRLNGPIGVMAVAKALIKEGHSEEEKAFLLSELALEVYRTKPQENTGCLPASTIQDALVQLLKDIQAMLPIKGINKKTNMAKYIKSVWEEVSK